MPNQSKVTKAYLLSIKDNDDAGQAVVFANNAKEAKAQIYGTNLGDTLEEWIDIRVHRDKRYDGMENLSGAQLAKEQWRCGWRWFDMHYPDVEEATDQEFLDWYKNTFELQKEKL